nr:MAG TPA: hypothetical protein [Caudoviricetes sp.]
MSQEPSVTENSSVVGGSFIFDRPEVAKLREIQLNLAIRKPKSAGRWVTATT